MRIYILLITLSLFFSCKEEIPQPVGASNMDRVSAWEQCIFSSSQLNIPFKERSNATVSYNEESVFIIGGGEPGTFTNLEIWEVKPPTRKLTLLTATAPQFLSGAISFLAQGKLYYGFGLADLNYNNVIWSKTPTGSWSTISNIPVEARSNCISFTIGTKVYVGLGRGVSGYFRDLYEFNPALNTWKKMADMPGGGRTDAAVFVLNNKAYVGTGFDGTYYLKDFYAFDPSKNTWDRIPDLPGYVRDDAVAFAFEKRGYVGTGWNPVAGVMKDFYEYNALTNQWKLAPQINTGARYGAVAFTFGGKAYVGTGNDADELNDFFVSK
jgi:N-acetylneuraminic acid mutarotase